MFPAFGPRESGSAVCSRRLRQMVHPDSQELDRERSPVPEGYTPYTYEFRGRHGKMQRERLFLKNTPIITESEVEQARIEPERRECLHITLNTQGGKTMKAATSAMNLGRDRLALVVQGKIKSAPVVQAVISRTFEISGLDGKNEASGLAELLNRQASTEKNPPFISQDLALYAVHPESRRLVEEGVLRVPGFRLWKLPAHRQEKTGEEEYLFLGNSPIIPETAPGMRSQIWNIREAWTSPGTKKHSVNWSGHRPDYAPARTGLLSFCAEPFCPPPYSRECLPALLLFPVWGMTAGWMPCAGPSTTPVCR
nr:hypothetical protein [Akkermansia muciniphila]